jgi:hypothetical protein
MKKSSFTWRKERDCSVWIGRGNKNTYMVWADVDDVYSAASTTAGREWNARFDTLDEAKDWAEEQDYGEE